MNSVFGALIKIIEKNPALLEKLVELLVQMLVKELEARVAQA